MTATGRTRVFAGIDEAGLGPLLGPMTLGWSAFRVPRGRVELWGRLERVVARDPCEDRERLVVADSKRVFTRNPRGTRRLETTALAFLAQLDPEQRWPRSADELFELAPPALRPPRAELDRHPWYRLLPARLPEHQEEERLRIWAHRLGRELEQQGVSLVDAGVRPVPAGELNASFRETENKAATQWRVVAGIVQSLWTRFGREGLTLFVDRLGGRRHYRPLLEALFPSARLETRREGDSYGEYRVLGEERRMRIAFAERGEERSFSVALASCLAKYARELSMDAFNRFFGAIQPGLRPTAGYTTDGRRWLEEARPALENTVLEPGVLIRER